MKQRPRIYYTESQKALARRLKPARKRFGRRVLFSVAELARFIDES